MVLTKKLIKYFSYIINFSLKNSHKQSTLFVIDPQVHHAQWLPTPPCMSAAAERCAPEKSSRSRKSARWARGRPQRGPGAPRTCFAGSSGYPDLSGCSCGWGSSRRPRPHYGMGSRQVPITQELCRIKRRPTSNGTKLSTDHSRFGP